MPETNRNQAVVNEWFFNRVPNFGRDIGDVAVAGRSRLLRKSLRLEARHAIETSLALCRSVSKSAHGGH